MDKSKLSHNLHNPPVGGTNKGGVPTDSQMENRGASSSNEALLAAGALTASENTTESRDVGLREFRNYGNK